ncbi:MAG TPA: DsbE family thiol:disulfide interchange protein [Rhodocyclaceae bacterium]|nr:DsbE family thiol:disulfide interchange protein [Rhodocyclaceae bacterium]
MSRYLIPLGAFLVLALFLGVGLRKDPHDVPSPLIGKPAPAFVLDELPLTGHDAAQGPARFSSADMAGKAWLLNVWASWCGSCREEHPFLLELAQQGVVPIVGLDYKDQRVDARQMLKQAGSPYQRVAFDGDGRVGINYGVYGVPETYLIDAHGLVRYKQTGPMTRQVWEEKMLPLFKEAKQ